MPKIILQLAYIKYTKLINILTNLIKDISYDQLKDDKTTNET